MSTEVYKGGVHFIVGGFVAAFALYNLMEYLEKRRRHSLLNACAYAGVITLEAVNTHHHWSKPAC